MGLLVCYSHRLYIAAFLLLSRFLVLPSALLTPCFLCTCASHARVPMHMYTCTAFSAVLFLHRAFTDARVVIHVHFTCTCTYAHVHICTASSAVLFIHRAFTARVVIHMLFRCTCTYAHVHITYMHVPWPCSSYTVPSLHVCSPLCITCTCTYAHVPICTASSAVLFLRRAFSARVHHMHVYLSTCT